MKIKINNQSGQLLLEVLISIGAVAFIAAIAGQLISAGMNSNRSSGEVNVALGLNEEVFEAVRSASTEQWQNIYDLSKGNVNYYPEEVAGKWTVATGTQSIVVNNFTYTRYFNIQNVCRDSISRNIIGVTDSSGSTITCITNGGNFDPSTLNILSYVASPNTEVISANEYITRWSNKICNQNSWTTQDAGVTTCPASTYGNATNITTGGNLQLCQGGC